MDMTTRILIAVARMDMALVKIGSILKWYAIPAAVGAMVIWIMVRRTGKEREKG